MMEFVLGAVVFCLGGIVGASFVMVGVSKAVEVVINKAKEEM